MENQRLCAVRILRIIFDYQKKQDGQRQRHHQRGFCRVDKHLYVHTFYTIQLSCHSSFSQFAQTSRVQ